MKQHRFALCFVSIALGIFTPAADSFPNDIFEKGVKYLKQRKYDEAASQFLTFVRRHPDQKNSDYALYSAARIRMLIQERHEQGEQLFLKLIENYPESEWAFYGSIKLAEFYETKKDSVHSATYYDKAASIGEKIHPSITSVSDPQFKALRNCANAYMKLKQYRQAEQYYFDLKKTGVEDRYQMPEIYFNLALCFEKNDKAHQAAKVYVELIRNYANSRQAMSLINQKQKVDPYEKFNWAPYEYFVEGYKVLRTQPYQATKHLQNLAQMGADSSLVQFGLRLVPWILYYANDFESASKAHAAYQKLYPHDQDNMVKYFPMYLADYQQNFEFKKYLTHFSVLRIEADTSQSLSESDEYQFISEQKHWVELDLTPNFGIYNHTLYVDRPLNKTDRAYLRFFVKTDKATPAYLEVDCDEPGRVWQNATFFGTYEADAKKPLALQLQTGWNEIIIQILQTQKEMKATVRLLNPEKQVDRRLVCAATKE